MGAATHHRLAWVSMALLGVSVVSFKFSGAGVSLFHLHVASSVGANLLVAAGALLLGHVIANDLRLRTLRGHERRLHSWRDHLHAYAHFVFSWHVVSFGVCAASVSILHVTLSIEGWMAIGVGAGLGGVIRLVDPGFTNHYPPSGYFDPNDSSLAELYRNAEFDPSELTAEEQELLERDVASIEWWG